MAAAALTPTVVMKQYRWGTNSTGTPIRLVDYFVKVTKATQNDWIVVDTYTPGTLLMVDGFTIDTDGVQEAPTYTASGTKIILPSATTGTTYLTVTCQVS